MLARAWKAPSRRTPASCSDQSAAPASEAGTAAAAGTAASAAPVGVSDDTDSQAPEGVLGLTGQLVALLGSNYDLAYTGTSSADNRPALMVEAVREDGSLAARRRRIIEPAGVQGTSARPMSPMARSPALTG